MGVFVLMSAEGEAASYNPEVIDSIDESVDEIVVDAVEEKPRVEYVPNCGSYYSGTSFVSSLFTAHLVF